MRHCNNSVLNGVASFTSFGTLCCSFWWALGHEAGLRLGWTVGGAGLGAWLIDNQPKLERVRCCL